MNQIILFLFLLVLVVRESCAWHTVAGVHSEITRQALSLNELNPVAFPDLQRYTMQIKYGANDESHNTSVGSLDNNIESNGGYPLAWWETGIDLSYGNPDTFPCENRDSAHLFSAAGGKTARLNSPDSGRYKKRDNASLLCLPSIFQYCSIC